MALTPEMLQQLHNTEVCFIEQEKQLIQMQEEIDLLTLVVSLNN